MSEQGKQSTRDSIVEECAAVCDGMAENLRKHADTLEPGYGIDGKEKRKTFLTEAAEQCEECAENIRLLKDQT